MSVLRVLISGCGYVGGALGARLALDGHEVFGLRRSPRGLREMPPGVMPVAADFTDPESLERTLPESLDYVFHTASPGVSPGMSSREREISYQDAYVRGPSNLISALVARGESPHRILLTSSTGVYAQSGGEWVDETSPTEPSGTGRRILEGEETVLGSPFPAVALRLAGIYGPGRTGALDRARRHPLSDTPGASGIKPTYTNRIHRDDCAGALRHLMLLDGPEPIYLGADHEPATPAELALWLAENHPEERQEEPAKDTGGIDAGRGRGRANTTNKRCSNARLVNSGYVFEYPTFREGFASLLGK